VIELGTMRGNILLEMPAVTLTESVPGKIYHLKILTNGVSNPQELFDVMSDGLAEVFRAKLYYLRVSDDGTIDMQIEGSPFAWAALLPWIPSILTLLGIAFIGIAVYSVLASIPSWAWALLAGGIFMIVIGPTVGKSLAEGKTRSFVYRSVS
jgi:hypothetical protein